jgi:ribosome-associated translation inhibitor RaiA
MHVQTNTDRNIEGSAGLSAHVTTVVAAALERFSGQVTRVEVHLSDENSDKGGSRDKRCMMEARLEGRPPTAVTHQAATVDEALNGAAAKLVRSLTSTLGRLRDY